MLEEVLREIIKNRKQLSASPLLIRNYLKEYLQYLILSLIYNQKNFNQLIFKGGSCLRIIYNLPRLSEDLDFDYNGKKIKTSLIEHLNEYLENQIKNKYYQKLETKIQKNFRIYLKFPILKSIGFSENNQTDKLFIKIELSDSINPYAGFNLTPISKYGLNFIIKSYDLPTLMAGKINAFLHRIWYKGKKSEIDIKGRDFYDLFWFFQNKIEPNWKTLAKLTGIKNMPQLKKVIKERIIKSVTPSKLIYDLSNFIEDRSFVENFSKNYFQIMKKYL